MSEETTDNHAIADKMITKFILGSAFVVKRYRNYLWLQRFRCCTTENNDDGHTSAVLPKAWFWKWALRPSFDLCGSTRRFRKRSAAQEICSVPERVTAEIQTALQQRPRQQKKLQVSRGLVARPTPRPPPPPPRPQSLKPRRHHPRHRGCGTRHLASLHPPRSHHHCRRGGRWCADPGHAAKLITMPTSPNRK